MFEQSGTPFGSQNSFNRKRNFSPRNLPAPFHAPHDIGPFDGHPNSRFGFGPPGPPAPPSFGGWYPRHGRPAGNAGSPPQRPFDTTPPAMPYEFSQSQPFYPPMPYGNERRFSGPFRRSAEGFQGPQNKLFLDEYRSPGPHQVRRPFPSDQNSPLLTALSRRLTRHLVLKHFPRYHLSRSGVERTHVN